MLLTMRPPQADPIWFDRNAEGDLGIAAATATADEPQNFHRAMSAARRLALIQLLPSDAKTRRTRRVAPRFCGLGVAACSR
jgi:hypothetical protein